MGSLASLYTQIGIRPIHDTVRGDHHHQQHQDRIKIKKMTRVYEDSAKFPKLEECAHFHYDFVELGPIKVDMEEAQRGEADDDEDGDDADVCSL